MQAEERGNAPAGDFAQLAIQVARLDERTLAMQRQIDERFGTFRSEVRTLIGGLYVLIGVGLTVIGWLVTHRLPS